MSKIYNVIFDFGGVLVDWNPRYLYRDYFDNEDEMEQFLLKVCNNDWNIEQDRGRSLAEGTRVLQEKFPEFSSLIELYYKNWPVMLKGEISGTVHLLNQLKSKYKIYGLTNWSAETIVIAYERYAFFQMFDGIVVSAEENQIKPDREIYETLLNRYALNAESSVFIDDNLRNVQAARELGMVAIHFKNPEQLESELIALNMI